MSKATLHTKAINLLRKYLRKARTIEARQRIEEVQFHTNGYAEPGYPQLDVQVIATGNWNRTSRYDSITRTHIDEDTSPSALGEALEKIGVEIEWSDEWTVCGECGKLVRTSPDSYCWTPSYHAIDDEILCHECIEKDPQALLDHCEGNHNRCVTIALDLEQHGYKRVEQDFENGLYGGQNASPQKIAESLGKYGVSKFVFKLDAVRQFDQRFSVWVHESEYGTIEDKYIQSAGVDPAEQLKKALASAPIVSSKPGVIAVTDLDLSTGTSSTREVTHQEFIEKGIK